MQDVFIASANRIPIGKLNGILSNLTSIDMGSFVIKEAINRVSAHGIESEIDEVIIGNIIQTEKKGNPAREIIIKAGLPTRIPAYTVNKNCGSSNKAINLGAMMIRHEEASIIIAGGIESMTNAPHILRGSRKGYRLGDRKLSDFLTDMLMGMGITAENIAKKYGITRGRQDEFAYISQKKVKEAKENHYYKDEIAPIQIDCRKNIVMTEDEGNRPDTTIEGLERLRPVFLKDGTVTAGNSSTINDGAAALMLVSEKAIKKHRIKPLARIVSWASSGVDPDYMGIGPVPATRLALKKAGLSIDDMDLIELNEAFAAQTLACIDELGIDEKKLNIKGGAIALGHPVGATGAILFTKIIYDLIRIKKRYGLITLCIGGGQGIATIIENLYF